VIGNILILLVVIGLGGLLGWLTYRALRARKLWVKIVGGLGAGLLTLVLATVAFFGGKGVAQLYFPGAPPAPELAVAGTPEQIARGEYLVTIACMGCHTQVGADGNPSGRHPLSGGFNLSEADGFGFIGDMVTENLTPGGKLAGYSDGELFRVLRYSVNQQGHTLGVMSFMPYRELSDDDTEAIIAYLRSLPPTPTAGLTGDRLNFVGAAMLGAGMFGEPPPPAPATIAAPPQGTTAEYGKYVATFGECRGCHGPEMTGSPATSISPAVPNPRPFVGTLTLEQFTAMMHSGVRPDGRPFPATMPWENASHMNDDDLVALYTYLTTQP
jgi:mono/diheme cytochrome c family protein